MTINLREDAPDQSDVIDPKKLSEELEKLKTVKASIELKEKQIKELKEQEKNFSNIVIPKMMMDMNLKTLKLADGSEVSIKDIFSATIKADKKTILSLPLARAKTTRQWRMLPLQKSRAMNRLKKRLFTLLL